MLNGHIMLPVLFAGMIWNGSDRIILKCHFIGKIGSEFSVEVLSVYGGDQKAGSTQTTPRLL
jgi:hypothetical protein